MRYGSLFTGIGGIDLGLCRAGMQPAWMVEIDDYCQRVLAKHWPDVPKFRDVRECGAANLAPVDLVCGGFPCQPHSLAGRRAGSADERDLWGEFARIIGELRPAWVLAENVPGLLSSENGRFFGRVLRDLAERGYDAEWDCIPAAALGAPHLRYRVFLVAYASQRGRQQEGRSHQPSNAARRAPGRPTNGCQNVADTSSPRLAQRQIFGGNASQKLTAFERSCSTLPDADGEQMGRSSKSWGERGIWATEPDIRRVADGVPGRLDRLRGLGNAVVPQVAEWTARRIMAAEDAP